MENRSGRRSFLKQIGVTGTATAFFPGEALNEETGKGSVKNKNVNAEIAVSRKYNGEYTNEFLNRVAFPMGGIGAGMVCMEGTGALSHVSIKNKPDIFNEPTIFAAIVVKGKTNIAKILEGPVPDWKKFGQRDAGNGSGGATTGLPRFRNASFLSRFPFGYLDISDNDLPLKIKVTGWSPFIPGDDNNSSLPVAALEYRFVNTGPTSVDAIFSFNSKNFVKVDKGKNSISSVKNGFVLTEEGTKEKPFRTDIAFFTDDDNTVIDHCWFRGGWWDPITMAWNAVKNAELKAVSPVDANAPGASLYVPFKLDGGKEKTIRLMMAWFTPDSDYTYGEMDIRKEKCDPASGCCNSPSDISLDKYDKDFHGKFYKPWYSSLFKNIKELITYWSQQYNDLRKKSILFKDAFYASTLPPEVIEAVAANLTILKSPTVMRQYDGRLWSFEGCGDGGGCCHGSCTHVWNYAQAIVHLFPALERSLRNTEFCESQNEEGHQNFRATLPIEQATHSFHSAADGQLGGIMKVYREWRISGDHEWLRKIFPMAKASLDYCIRTWDPRGKGVIEEPHHNTYDIEFWGPDGMHTSFYIGALNAFAAMGEYLKKDVTKYKSLASLGKKFIETELYDGEFFIQKIQYKGLNAKDPTTEKSFGGEYSAEAKDLLEKEGPKYQYGKGCLSDGVLGAWIARMCGLDDAIDPVKLKSHLLAVHKYNLKANLLEHANLQRPSFALGNEGGLLLCTWPKGGKLSLPFVYSDEVWTGIEHQVASHLMMMGHVKEGLDIVRASRNRYDGRIRNPFNEYECGHWYARALSSYGYLQALTGVRYDAVERKLYVDSKVGDFTSFLSTETGFGSVSLKTGKVSVNVVYGKIDIETISISGKTTVHKSQ
ncbi:MAG TPA: GH116 family glycosyl hydrolase [Chitinophagaceae bacterium]|nr:GH116 family glycosyl hydrolase [Chitinophagaceae bacterium]